MLCVCVRQARQAHAGQAGCDTELKQRMCIMTEVVHAGSTGAVAVKQGGIRVDRGHE